MLSGDASRLLLGEITTWSDHCVAAVAFGPLFATVHERLTVWPAVAVCGTVTAVTSKSEIGGGGGDTGGVAVQSGLRRLTPRCYSLPRRNPEPTLARHLCCP